MLIAEDQGMIRGALSALLELQGGFDVVAQCSDGQEALQYLLKQPVDLVLTDIEMPLLSGLELVSEVKRRLESPPKMVLLSTFSRHGYVSRAATLQVDGYLLKEAPSEDLARSLKKIMRGKRIFDPSLLPEEADGHDPLADRERQVLRLAEEGKSTAEIAQCVHRSEGTVRNILSEVIKKLGSRNRTEALRKAREKGWL